ncbi:porin family protein [Aequorivita capsosiphonis]|uniref:porin family protein n=1 Tax=Aequorivita capsosiphonis TaxID=487317 RepID=UPI000412D5DD|nr:porin family protein [Aequorivita capsosiphonis]
MKKLMIAVVAIFMGTTAFSQEIDLGIKAGANFANISDASGLSNKTGFQAGIFAGIKFTDKVGIQADMLYSQQGGDFDFGDFDLTYINVPVVLKYYLFQGLNIQAGPQFGFIVDDKITVDLGDVVTDAKAENFDLSGVVGAGYDFPFGIRLDARYNFGLTDVSKIDGADGKNSVFSVALGYSFL